MTIYILTDDDPAGDSLFVGAFSSEAAAIAFIPRASEVFGQRVSHPTIEIVTVDAPTPLGGRVYRYL